MRNILLISALALFMLGCTAKPVMNLENVAVPTITATTKSSMEDVQQAIISACLKRGWTPKVVSPGLIEASLSNRSHNATIEIPFSANAYSIHYKASENLNYNGKTIHRNYNNWVVKLSRSIQVELGMNAR